MRNMPSKRTPLVLVYEAGPGGYGLSRSLTQKGPVCWGVAPALLPTKAGDRVTTTRRDAMPLARLMRAGALTPVSVPQVADEAIRDRSRAREEALRALTTAQHRRKALLLRPALHSPGPATWGPAPLRWLREVVCPTPAQHLVCQADVRAVTDPSARLARLEPALQDQGPTGRLRPVVAALQALRRVQCPVAVTIVAALGDLTRVDTPSPLLRSRGLTPAAYSPGDHRPPGALTTTGQAQARRARIAGAWASRHPATGSRHRQGRRAKRPNPLQESSG